MAANFSMFLAGDALIIRPWSHVRDPAFLKLIEEIRAADVSIANLETVIHEFNGYAQRDSGGTHLASPPVISKELRWAGFDMLAHANNHTFDYGSSAILETLKHIKEAGLILAGSGPDLQQARSPRYFQSTGGIVALVAMASTFIPYGAASRSGPDLPGRPGLNPLTLTQREWAFVVPPVAADHIRAFGRFFHRNAKKIGSRSFRVGARFHVGESLGIEFARQLTEIDRDANLAAIAEAANCADIVVASIHAHNQGRWLREFAGDVIGKGADIVFVHGPHEARAIELRDGKPIFYSMGDFAFEVESINRLPADAYERAGLDEHASPRDVFKLDRKRGTGLLCDPRVFEGVAASISIAAGRIARIRLLPLDLQFNGPDECRGRPKIAPPKMGKRIIESVAALSHRCGTRIHYNADTNCGDIDIS